MDTLYSLFPDADGLLKLKPEDLAPILLKLALPRQQTAGFIPASVTQVPHQPDRGAGLSPLQKDGDRSSRQ